MMLQVAAEDIRQLTDLQTRTPSPCVLTCRNRGAEWTIIQGDVHDLDGQPFTGIDLFAGGLPCPPFSFAGSSARRYPAADGFGLN